VYIKRIEGFAYGYGVHSYQTAWHGVLDVSKDTTELIG